MLSRMAGLVGAQLVSFNLSQQTDSSDLLGGFKPVEPRDALAPLLPTFASLIRRTWTKWVPIPDLVMCECVWRNYATDAMVLRCCA